MLPELHWKALPYIRQQTNNDWQEQQVLSRVDNGPRRARSHANGGR